MAQETREGGCVGVALLRRILGKRVATEPSGAQPSSQDSTQFFFSEGSENLEVVGESFYQDALWDIVGARPSESRIRHPISAVLVAEHDNEYDANAISVWVAGRKVGHLSREGAARYRPGLLALEREKGAYVALRGAIMGGGLRHDGPGQLGVFLKHDPTEFGLAGTRSQPSGGMRTGLSDALGTDLADDSYDLSWLRDLPSDGLKAIAYLRKVLQGDQDPIDRHFAFNHLESLLYKSREAFASALDEYDEVCRSHDAEMERICEAFVHKWGSIPLLTTYRQMAIRQQKAKNFQQAMWWAERGLTLYADKAARPEAVDDLRKRAEKYRQEVGPDPPS